MNTYPTKGLATTLWYRYRNCESGAVGWYQCDYEDFKNLWRNAKFHRTLYYIEVLYQGKYWRYDAYFKRWLKLRMR